MGCLFLLLSLLFIRWGWLWVLNTNEWIFGPTYDCLFWIINSVWKTSELSRKQLRSHRAGPVEDADGNAHECREHLWMCNVLLKVSSCFPLGCTFPARTFPVSLLLLQAPQYLQHFCWNAAEKRNIWQVTKPEWLGKAEKSLGEGATSAW